MDTRGQGGTWAIGATPDPGPGSGPEHPGVMTRGVLDPSTYYYRRLYIDAVRAVERRPRCSPGWTPTGSPSGARARAGGLSLAAAALAPDVVRLCLADVPFLCAFERALAVAGAHPYLEVVQFLALHPERTSGRGPGSGSTWPGALSRQGTAGR